MVHKGFSYEFSRREAAYLLFGKKICPRCGSRLKKRKDFEMRLGAELNSKVDPIFVPDAKIRQYRYYFYCRKCNREFSLNELAERKKRF